MDPKLNLHEKEKLRMVVARDRKITIAVSLAVCLLCAGIIGIKAELPTKGDPRMENVPAATVLPMDPHFEGYLPNDAVIPTRDGIYITDSEGKFKKLSKGE